MNKCNGLWFFIALLAIISASCTVEKRHYQNGFHVEWFHRQKQDTPTLEASRNETTSILKDSMITDEQVPPSIENDFADENAGLQKKVEGRSSKTKTIQRDKVTDRPIKRAIASGIMAPKLLSRISSVSSTTPSAELDRVASVLGIIAFMLGILTILSLIMALIVTEGWAALGWVAMMVILGLATALFGLIAQTIFWSKHQGIPWFQWLPLVISGAAIVVLVKVITGK